MKDLILGEYGYSEQEKNRLKLFINNSTAIYDNGLEYKGTILITQYENFFTIIFDGKEFFIFDEYHFDFTDKKKHSVYRKLNELISNFISENKEKIDVDVQI